MWLHIGVAAAKDLAGAIDRQLFRTVDFLASAMVATAGITFGIFVGEHASCASSTARDTMFSLAISAIPSCCRTSSACNASASSGSVSKRGAEKSALGLD